MDLSSHGAARPAMQNMERNESWKLESERSAGDATNKMSAAIATELSSSTRRKKRMVRITSKVIRAARKTGGRCSTTATYASTQRTTAIDVHVRESLSLRAVQKRNAAKAPTCSPATTSTWKTPVF